MKSALTLLLVGAAITPALDRVALAAMPSVLEEGAPASATKSKALAGASVEPSSSSQEEEQEAPRRSRFAEPRKRVVTVAFSPLQLLLPIFQMSTHVRIGDDFSVGAIGGYGSVPVNVLNGTSSANAWEAGAQFLYFAEGSFDGGMEVGLEALFTHVAIESGQGLSSSVAAAGLAIGPLLGWKLVTKAGFTFDSQIGIAYLAAKQSVPLGATGSSRSAVLIGNLDVGWSF